MAWSSAAMHSHTSAMHGVVPSVRELLRRRPPPRNLYQVMRGVDAAGVAGVAPLHAAKAVRGMKRFVEVLESASAPSLTPRSLACFPLDGWEHCRVGHCRSRIDETALSLAKSYRKHDPHDAAGCGRLCANHAAFTVRLDPSGCFCWRDCQMLDTAHWVQIDDSSGHSITHVRAISFSRKEGGVLEA